MKRFIIVAATVAMVSACGHSTEDRAASGAGIGAGVGLIAGPPGVIVGGLAGAAVGSETRSDQVNLGKPLWEKGSIVRPEPKPWWAQ